MSRWLFGSKPLSADLAALLLRACIGSFLLTHGLPKLMHFSEMATHFANPIGVGSTASLVLAIFAEVFCAMLVILGAFTRLALVVLIVFMLVIVLLVFTHEPFGRKELALLYLVPFAALFFLGPGRFSLDALRK